MSKQWEKFLVWWAPFKPQDTNRLDRVAFAAWQAALAAQAQEAPSELGILAAPNTLGGFLGGFASSNRREPTAQEIFDAGVRSGMQRSPAPASAQAAMPEVAALQAEIARLTELNCLYPDKIQRQHLVIENLTAEEEISASVIKKMSTILADIAITLKGEEVALQSHGFQDLAEITKVNTLELEFHRSQQFDLQARLAELDAQVARETEN